MLSEVVRNSLFRCHQQRDAIVLELDGDFRRCSYVQKQEDYNRMMQKLDNVSAPRVVFDLSQCQRLDSVTVGILIGLTRHAVRRGGQTGLVGVASATRISLDQLLLLEPRHRQLQWDIYDDVGSAVQSMRSDVENN
mgnify:CR=1 FL=1